MAEDEVRGPDAPLPAEPPAADSPPAPDPDPTSGPVPAPADWYAPRRRRRWPWLAVPVALVLAGGGLLVQHRLATTTDGAPASAASAAPATVVPPVPGEQYGFALNGAGVATLYLQTTNAIQRAELGTGAATLTPTPALKEPSTLFAGPGWVASKTVDGPTGVLLRDGGGAQVLPVAIQQAGRAYPGPDGNVWVLPERVDRNDGRTAVLVDIAGDRVGDSSIRVPGRLGVPIGHLPGALLATNADGTYAASTEQVRRLTRGTLLGVGTDALISWDCDAKKKCDARINDPQQRAPQYLPAIRKSIDGLYRSDVASAAGFRGVLSPDRRWVALELPKPTRSGARLVLVDLRSGHRVEIPGALADEHGTDQAAWTPNSRYLLALTDGRLRAFDASTGTVVTVGGTPAGLVHLTIAGSATM